MIVDGALIDPARTYRLRKKMEACGRVMTFWKVLDAEMRSPYTRSIQWFPGIVSAHRDAIHVCQTLVEASRRLEIGWSVIRVTARLEDLLGVYRQGVAFRAVHFSLAS